MGSMKPNAARLKTAAEFKRAEFGDTDFGQSLTRAVLYALYELQRETDVDEVIGQLRDLVKGYYARRDDVIAVVRYLEPEARKARAGGSGSRAHPARPHPERTPGLRPCRTKRRSDRAISAASPPGSAGSPTCSSKTVCTAPRNTGGSPATSAPRSSNWPARRSRASTTSASSATATSIRSTSARRASPARRC